MAGISPVQSVEEQIPSDESAELLEARKIVSEEQESGRTAEAGRSGSFFKFILSGFRQGTESGTDIKGSFP